MGALGRLKGGEAPAYAGMPIFWKKAKNWGAYWLLRRLYCMLCAASRAAARGGAPAQGLTYAANAYSLCAALADRPIGRPRRAQGSMRRI